MALTIVRGSRSIALTFQGSWNASTNSPALASGVGQKGDYFVVNQSGSTNLDGVTDWVFDDFVTFNGIAWQKVDNTNPVILSYGCDFSIVGRFARVNGDPDETEVTGLQSRSEAISPITGKLQTLAWNSDSANSTTRIKIHIDGSVLENFLLTADFGTVELSAPVNKGDKIAIEFDAQTTGGPGGSTWQLMLTATGE